ncbi:DUF4012 domain-containing protein [Patescibacteria group bacterium]|nr:DUF4012 domain-containing protein [Patescibacteria group bacterium]
MIIRLDIGPENEKPFAKDRLSEHVLNVKTQTDAPKEKPAAAINIKDEIKSKSDSLPGRICIVGELSAEKQGLGRMPMVAAALLIIVCLNVGQALFLGKSRGNDALAIASEAFTSLKSASESVLTGEEGADSLLFTEADKLFAEAENKGRFLLANESDWLPEPKEVRSLRNLLEAGSLMSEVGQHLANAKTSFNNLPKEGSLTDYLRSVSESQIEPASDKLKQINALLDEVDLTGTDYLSDFMSFRDKINALQTLLDLWISAKEPLLTLLGDRYPQRYLVLLENNDELRPGGGFTGSYLIVDINDGRIENISFHDVYELDNLYFEHQEVPIHELKELTPEWRLRDANIYPDFPSSAQKALWFLEQEGGPSADGVIAVNLSTAQTLLETVGPIKIPSLQKELTAETLPAVLSTLVEAKTYGQSSPKQVLSEIIDAFAAKLDNQTLVAKVGFALYDEAKKKQVLVYHKDPAAQKFIESMNLDGTIPPLSTLEDDFLMPIFTNIGANKTDRYMQTDLKHETQIFHDGTIVNALTLTRTNTFTPDTLAWLKNVLSSYGFTKWDEHLEKVLGAGPSHTGIRIYVPEGSVILDTKGILRDEIQLFYDPQNAIQYYYIDQTVQSGETKTISIIYGLPWSLGKNFDEYIFRMYRQPGLRAIRYEKTVNAEDYLMLSSTPLATENREGTDYTLNGEFKNNLELKLLYK